MELPSKYQEIDLQVLIDAVKAAGEEILKIYATDFQVETKGDDSPLTAADQAANKVLMDYVNEHTSHIPVISEENKEVDYSVRKEWSRFWLIDPLDGTKEFIKKNGEFTVNIALIDEGRPKLGVVYQPTTDTFYIGISDDASYKIDAVGAVSLIKNETHYAKREEDIVVASRSHLSDDVVAFVDDLKSEGKSVEFLSAGSSLKFCLVAEGKAHVYPRLGPTMEWDTGAAHAVALGAGLDVIDHETRRPLLYNKENLLNPYFIVA